MPPRGSRSATSQPAHLRRARSDDEAAMPAGTRDLRASWASLEGLPIRLGATWIVEEGAWNFAVYSEHADLVTLLLYTEEDPASPVLTRRLDHLRHKSGPVWHCRIPAAEMKGARFYAYQVEGPRSPHHSFDADKILFDLCGRPVRRFLGYGQHAELRASVRAADVLDSLRYGRCQTGPRPT